MFNSVYASGSDESGIDCGKEQLQNGNCTLKVYQTLGIRDNEEAQASVFIQDIFGAATMFIGTVVVISLVVSGFMYVLAGADEQLADKAKNGMKYSIIGLLLVSGSYAIIRLIQYLAAGGL